jgi:hypothetical protein
LVYRGRHGAKVGADPVCPVVESAMMHMGINVQGEEFTTPMEAVYAYVPIINQLLTILSNAVAYNGLPRWVVELTDGSTLRGEDGEPKLVAQDIVPGLDPSQAAAYPGTVRQLLIDTSAMQEFMQMMLERLEACMPSASAQGEAGASAAAWQVRLQIQQAQENLRQPVSNHAMAVKQILQMWHAWERDLGLPIYFFAQKAVGKGERAPSALIEFDPANLTDSIQVHQELDTPEEQTVRVQQGLDLRAAGAITWQEFFEDYLRVQDAREAEIEMYAQMCFDQIMTGAAYPPGSLIQVIADSVRGQLQYILIKNSDNYALSMAENMAANAEMAMQQEMQAEAALMGGGMGGMGGGMGMPPGGTQPVDPNVTDSSGIRQPGMGMAGSIEQQMGTGVPGGNTPMAPVGV